MECIGKGAYINMEYSKKEYGLIWNIRKGV